MRRQFYFVLAVAALLVTSGCTLPGADLTASASPAGVNDAALNATGYAVEERGTVAINETMGIDGEDHEIGVTNHIVSYRSAEDDGQFVVFSTPSPDAEGAPANPFANRSELPDIARMFGELNNTTPMRVTHRQNVTTLGGPTEVVTYSTTNRTESGATTPVLAHVAVVHDGGDAVVAVGVHRRSVDDGAAMRRLIRGLEHGESA